MDPPHLIVLVNALLLSQELETEYKVSLYLDQTEVVFFTDLQLQCFVNGSFGEYTRQWTKDRNSISFGGIVVNGSKYSEVVLQNTSNCVFNLIIHTFVESDLGQYKCFYGTEESQISLEMDEKFVYLPDEATTVKYQYIYTENSLDISVKIPKVHPIPACHIKSKSRELEFSVVATNRVGNFYSASFQRQFLISKDECGDAVGICCHLGRRIVNLNQTYIINCSKEEDTHKQENVRSFEVIVPLLVVFIIILALVTLLCLEKVTSKLKSLKSTWSAKYSELLCYGIIYGYNVSIFNQPLKLIRAYYLVVLEERSENSSKDVEDDWILAAIVSLFFICGFFGSILYTGLKCFRVLVDGRFSIWFVHLLMLISGVIGLVSVSLKSYECVLISRAITGLSYGYGINYLLHYHSELKEDAIRVANILYQLSISMGILLANVVGFPNMMGAKEQLFCLFAVNAVLSLGCLCGTYFLNENTARTEEENINNLKLFWKQLKQQIDLKSSLLIACCLTVFRQITGIIFIMGYSSSIFAALGQEINEIGLLVVLISAVYFIMTIVSIFLLYNFERRVIEISLTVIMLICLLVVTYLLNISQHNQTNVEVIAGITAVTLFVISFALGLDSIPYIIIEKLFTVEQMPQVSLVSMAVNWLLNFIIMLVFIPFQKGLSGYIFVPSLVFIFLGLIMILQIPETKGKDREEIQKSLPKVGWFGENTNEEFELTNLQILS